MKFTDVIAHSIKANEVKCVFGLQGGAVVHIFDSLERLNVPVVYTHHESSASFAAAANAKSSNCLGCAVVTTGPGATNAITGLMGAWQDSVPCIFLSGQVRSNHMSYGKPVRQVGSQEVNITDVVKPLTKYSKVIINPDSIQEEINKAIKIAISGRPGPVWLDLPLEFQWSDVKFEESKCKKVLPKVSRLDFDEDLNLFTKYLEESKSPLFVLGYGCILSGMQKKIKNFIEENDFRCVTTWTAGGIFSTKSKNNLGIIGMSGQPGANKAVFSSDLLIALGTHLSIPHTTTLTDSYAPKAKKIFVNIDKDQLDHLNLRADLKIHADLRQFINKLVNKNFKTKKYRNIDQFKKLNIKKLRKTKRFVDPNMFFRKLTEKISNEDGIIIDGGGTALYTGFQASDIKEDQKIICSSAISSMGTGLAETIGSYMSKEFRTLYCIIGDGSTLMNIQDLQSISDMKIPCVICVINNNGYLAIRHTQQGFLENRYYGTHPDWKLGIVDFKDAAKAFKLQYFKLDENKQIDSMCKKVLNTKKPILLEVLVSENQPALFSQQYVKNKDGTSTPKSLEYMK
tara:strand:+ start:15451 stop:17157 length:1707 start_codon:yes stop_codon:yes gene_type:complete